MFPQADILRFNEISNGGLLLYGLIFNPEGNLGGSYNNVERISVSSGRHTVYKASIEGRDCILKEHVMNNNREIKRLLKETRILKTLNHPAVASIDEVVLGTDGSKAYIQMPFYKGGNMLNWLNQRNQSKQQMKAVLHEITRAIEYIHDKQVIHCDIKLENIFMTSASPNALPKLGDFDTSKDSNSMITNTTTTVINGGTNIYMSPERFSGSVATEASDIYSLGVLMLLALSDRAEELSIQLSSTLTLHLHDKILQSVRSYITDANERNLIQSLLEINPDSRKTAKEVLQHSYFDLSGRLLELQRREEEQRVAEEKKERNNQTAKCILCLHDFRLFDGLCSFDEEFKHFMCRSCLDDHVNNQVKIENIDQFSKADSQIVFPLKAIECTSRCFTEIEIARNISEETFKLYIDHLCTT